VLAVAEIGRRRRPPSPGRVPAVAAALHGAGT